ncbi:hypothetical protein AZE42_09077 [Rhizopogon vesiculosus]|uniref:Cytochrome P450 n=1 Tax=Rhizopogon vesiculosus TaxID=180088 RepID=A0A1J8QR05_9AGAM|nr:hypothetical protein AZE42_09077 [Rhizopogon vesiculosus]
MTLANLTWLDICLAGVGAYLMSQTCLMSSPGSPLLSGARTMPWLTFAEWGKKYGKCLALCRYYAFRRLVGDISHIEVLGQHIIVLKSINTTMQMLDKKSSMYSDRPVFPMAGELVGWKGVLTLLPYGDHLRWHRKNFHRIVGSPTAMKVYHQIEAIETHRFLKRVLAEPGELMEHIRQYGYS